jgi:cytochrome c peroxidase
MALAVAVAGLGIAALGGSARDATGDAPLPLTPAERAGALALGPWPPPAIVAAAAAAGAMPARVAFGERLFHSARLAGPGGVRCASCHEPFRRFTDGRARARGRADGARNTPTLLNVAGHRVFGWDGARDRLDDQSLRPMRDPAEMAATPARVAALVRGDPDLRAAYGAAFAAAPPADDDTVFADVGRALAAYEATLASPRAPFDAWRDALAAGRDEAAALDPAARRGLRLFVGRGGCSTCHAGPMLGDDALRVSTVHSLRPDGSPDAGHAGAPANMFRTPSLREAAATAPYMHDGSVARLCDAARPHALAGAGAGTDSHSRMGTGTGSSSGVGAAVERAGAATLTAAERDDIAAFLRTLGPRAGSGADEAPARPCAAG